MKLRAWRTGVARLSQQAVADRLDCELRQYQRYEQGRVPADAMKRRLFVLSGGLVTPNDYYDFLTPPAPAGADRAVFSLSAGAGACPPRLACDA